MGTSELQFILWIWCWMDWEVRFYNIILSLPYLAQSGQSRLSHQCTTTTNYSHFSSFSFFLSYLFFVWQKPPPCSIELIKCHNFQAEAHFNANWVILIVNEGLSMMAYLQNPQKPMITRKNNCCKHSPIFPVVISICSQCCTLTWTSLEHVCYCGANIFEHIHQILQWNICIKMLFNGNNKHIVLFLSLHENNTLVMFNFCFIAYTHTHTCRLKVGSFQLDPTC
jgi:hypothetical protein